MEIYESGLANFPTEYSFYEKIIKALNAQNKFTEANLYFDKMRGFYRQNLLTEDTMNFKNIAVDEFQWNGQWINVFKYFEVPKETLESLYTVYLIDKSGEKIERKINIEKTIQIKKADPKYVICEEITNGHSTFSKGYTDESFSLRDLRESIIEILKKNQKPAASIKLKK
ncbi:hypothetical protein [Chryseobacterium sp. MP_3.2]|uniref:hypothetical protein n=1 Tax=Chryseobacterium sp. MP_3.2 TaxID=3071712 RepID=UPI002E0705F0|nr:hypothetical protein [Chryseobacterium sp. MP_3.2]